MPQFAATIRHVAEGVKGFTISAAVKNIEGWEETLGKVETPGAKGIVRDLERLKKLIAKLGEETVTMAGKSDDAKGGRIKELGEALTSAAQ